MAYYYPEGDTARVCDPLSDGDNPTLDLWGR